MSVKNVRVSTVFNYIGGKTWLREKLAQLVDDSLTKNKHIDTYLEPFVGGLGSFLSVCEVLKKHNIKNVILNDINGRIIDFYCNIKQQPEMLLNKYMDIENEYISLIPKDVFKLNKTKNKVEIKKKLKHACDFYLKQRDLFNNLKIVGVEQSAILLFLQNHCYNGIYRENASGGYNTPFNWDHKTYNIEKIREKIYSVKDVFDYFNIQFLNKSYNDIDYKSNYLIYLDPPYINDEKIGENKYTGPGFNNADQLNLISKIAGLNYIYSNHKNDIIINNFKSLKFKFNYEEVYRKNIISGNNATRKNDKIEILIYS